MDPEPDAFLLAHRRRRRWLALGLAIAVLGPIGWLAVLQLQASSARRNARLGAAQKTELSALLDQREALARERVVRWNRAIEPDAIAALKVGTADCPVTLVPPSAISAAAYSKFATHDSAFGIWSLCILRAAADAPSCVRTYQPPEDLAPLRQRLADDEVYTWDLEMAPVQPEPEAVLVVVESEVRPDVHSPAVGRVTFTPGSLAGLSFLYAPEPGHFICGGAVTVRNSKNVDIEVSHFGESPSQQQSQAQYETRVALERDLELHLRFATTKALHALQSP